MPPKAAKVTQASLMRDRINNGMKANVVALGSDPRFAIEKIPTGSLIIDRLTGGGFARGRHSLLYGDFMVGKSLIVYLTLALAQARGETAALIDAEGVFDASWFTALGGDPDQLVLYPDRDSLNANRNANESGNVLRMMIQKGENIEPADVVGVDSVASLLPKEEEDHNLEEGDPRVASLARLMPLLLRQLTTKNGNTAIIWTNQWRDKIARVPGLKSTPGGRAMGFFSSTSIEMMEGEREIGTAQVAHHGKMVERKITEGRWVQCTATKEKTGARPWAQLSFMLDYETRQPDRMREIIDLGLADELIQRRSDRFYVLDANDKEHSAHGVKNMAKLLEKQPELTEYLVACITEQSFALGRNDNDE